MEMMKTKKNEKKRFLASSKGMYATIQGNGGEIWNSHPGILIHRWGPLMFELVMFRNGRDLDSVVAPTLIIRIPRERSLGQKPRRSRSLCGFSYSCDFAVLIFEVGQKRVRIHFGTRQR